MALSNWDILAVDQDGNPLGEPSFTTRAGVTFRFYKQWIYAESEQLWFDGCGFSAPVIAKITQGEVHLGGAVIHAVRGPKEGIYALVSERVREGEGWALRAMVGCACYGHEGDLWLGIQRPEVAFLAGVVLQHGEPELHGLDLSRALRQNQGDAFFAAQFGIPAPQTPPGDSDEPILRDALRAFEDGPAEA